MKRIKRKTLYMSFTGFKQNPSLVPEGIDTDDIDRRACDYIAGMSDRYAIHKYKELFIPRSWQVL